MLRLFMHPSTRKNIMLVQGTASPVDDVLMRALDMDHGVMDQRGNRAVSRSSFDDLVMICFV